MSARRLLMSCLFALAPALVAWPAPAQIRIGQTAGFTGPAASGVNEGTEGARLYIDTINARGGVNGQRIELISLDDKFEPMLAAENAEKLVQQRVVALFFSRGTPHTQAILPVLAKHRVPLIGPSPYQKEAERADGMHVLLLEHRRHRDAVVGRLPDTACCTRDVDERGIRFRDAEVGDTPRHRRGSDEAEVHAGQHRNVGLLRLSDG